MSSSSVYYKFRSQKEPSKITFDGTSISVWDIKKEIIAHNRMTKDLDFHLCIYDESGTREYKNDDELISRSALVIVKRLPAPHGRGSAYKYIVDSAGPTGTESRFNNVANASGAARGQPSRTYRGQMTMRFDGRDAGPSSGTSMPTTNSVTPASFAPNAEGGDDEASKIAAMFQATTEQWGQQQDQMSQATYRGGFGGGGGFRGRGGGPPRGGFTNTNSRSHEPPGPGYICHRCGKKGHWIQECPTNSNPDWNDKPKLKRTTGIPRSMLKTVEQPTDEQRKAGVMITSDGDFVIAQADTATWQKQRGKNKVLTKNDVYEMPCSDSSMTCSLCSRLLRDAVKTPCCGTRFCDECIQTHLLEHDFICPECEKRIADLDRVELDQETRDKVKEYIDEQIKKSEQEQEQEAANAVKQEQGGSAADGEQREVGEGSRSADAGGAEGGGDGAGAGWGHQANSGAASFQAMLQQFESMPPNPMATNMMVMQVQGRLQDPRINLGERQRLTGQLQYLQTLYMNQWQAMMTGGPMTQTGMTWGQQQAMQATNPFSHRAPNTDSDSPYMRVAINAKTHTTGRAKRERPMDSFEVGSEKRQRY